MAKEIFRCDSGHDAPDFTRRGLWFAAMNWEPGLPCSECNLVVRWFGQRPVPKALTNRERPIPYEVLYIAYLGNDAPDGEPWTTGGYFPFIMVLRLVDGRIELRPRYFIKPEYDSPASYLRYGQDGPILSPLQWTYLTQKIRSFLAQHCIPM
jgi:hypothetical protein